MSNLLGAGSLGLYFSSCHHFAMRTSTVVIPHSRAGDLPSVAHKSISPDLLAFEYVVGLAKTDQVVAGLLRDSVVLCCALG
jgi:hypothetical protein